MKQQRYAWQRFWWDPRGSPYLTDYGGYLLDPESRGWLARSNSVVPFSELAPVPCLGLLGEPGIGKTEEMRLAQEELKASGQQVLALNLGAYAQETSLIHALFVDDTYVQWQRGSHRLYLFLDSLDECLLRIEQVAALITAELERRQADVSRLFLRIACRTAVWPISLEKGLLRLWGAGAVRVYELAPLRRVDVEMAARAQLDDPESFLREVQSAGVQPLAMKPVTLEMLLRIVKRAPERGLGMSRRELYHEGCLELCRSSESRQDSRRRGRLDVDERLCVAGRIAAVTTICSRPVVVIGDRALNEQDGEVGIGALCGTEPLKKGMLQVDRAAVEDVLENTGLFALATARSNVEEPGRIEWRHASYSEYLTAWYLDKRGVPAERAMEWLAPPSESGRLVVPQLRGVAAWLASFRRDVFKAILAIDPEDLLKSDVAEPADRAELVDSLLELYDTEKAIDGGWGPDRYRDLKHHGLAAQLSPYLKSKERGFFARRVAVDIAEACERTELLPELLELALNPSEDVHLRKTAAHTVARIGDERAKQALRPLIEGVQEDVDDELKGAALRALWPGALSAAELFARLSHPRRDNFYGAYCAFLSDHVVPDLEPEDLAVALRWAESQKPRHELPLAIADLTDEILLRAWVEIEQKDVLRALARAVHSRMREGDALPDMHESASSPGAPRRIPDGDDRRRKMLVEALVSLFAEGKQSSLYMLLHGASPLVTRGDVRWLLEQVQAPLPENERKLWARLAAEIGLRRDPPDEEAINAVLAEAERSPILKDAVEPYLAWNLDDPSVQEVREHERRERERRSQSRSGPPPSEQIASLLAKCEAGDSAAWWDLSLTLSLVERHGRYVVKELAPDITTLPEWAHAGDDLRTRILRAAERYLLEQRSSAKEWFGENVLHRPAYAGYRALRLLQREDPSSLSALGGAVWAEWAPSIIKAFDGGSEKSPGARRELLRTAYKKAPATFMRWVFRSIVADDRQHGHLYTLRRVEPILDDRSQKTLLRKLQRSKLHLKPASLGDLLEVLLGRGSSEARECALSLVPAPPPADGDARARAVAAARTLLRYTPESSWPAVWSAVLSDAAFGVEVLSKLDALRDKELDRFASALSETSVADLYLWLVRQAPPDKDPERKGRRELYEVDPIRELRDGLLRWLAQRGTHESIKALERLSAAFPERSNLKWRLQEARKMFSMRSYRPPTPEELFDELAKPSEPGSSNAPTQIPEPPEVPMHPSESHSPAPPEGARATPESTEGAFAESAAWAPHLLGALRRDGASLARVEQDENDRHLWFLSIRLPEDVRARFGLSPEVMLVALTEGAIQGGHLRRAREHIFTTQERLEPDLTLVVDAEPDLEVRLQTVPAPVGQWIPWALRADGFVGLRDLLRAYVGKVDLFDEINPIRGRALPGREPLVQALIAEIGRGKSLGVFGLRKVGKTSLMRAVTDRLDPVSALLSRKRVRVEDLPRNLPDPHVVVAWIDAQLFLGSPSGHLFEGLYRELEQRLRALGTFAPPLPASHEDHLMRTRALLESVWEQTSLSVCIVIDEYDLMFSGDEGQPAMEGVHSLFGVLRALAQGTQRLSTVVIGRDPTPLQRTTVNGLPNPTLNWFSPYWLGPLSAEDAGELLSGLGKRMGLDVGPASRELALRWTGGHPYLHRQFGSALLELARSRETTAELVKTDLFAGEAAERFRARDQVRMVCRETSELLLHRFPEAASLSRELAAAPEADAPSIVDDHLGPSGHGAQTLQSYGLLLGSAAAPVMPEVFRRYIRASALAKGAARGSRARAGADRPRIFIGCSAKDHGWLKKLRAHLSTVERSGVDVWDSSQTTPGEPWREALRHAIDSAQIAVILASPSYFASEKVQNEELPRLLKAAEEGRLTILLVFVRACELPPRLSEIEPVNPVDQPLVGMKGREDDVLARLPKLTRDILGGSGARSKVRQDALVEGK